MRRVGPAVAWLGLAIALGAGIVHGCRSTRAVRVPPEAGWPDAAALAPPPPAAARPDAGSPPPAP